MIPTQAELEQIVREEVARGRFPGQFSITEHSDDPCFKAQIDTQTLSNISISRNPKYGHPEKTKPTVRDLSRHEIDHFEYEGHKGCPRELELHVNNIIEPMSGVLIPKGYSENDVHYVANCFEDSILHDDLNSEFSLDGICNFFEDVGAHTPKQKYTPFYEAHVKLNLYLWGSKAQKRMLKRFFSQFKKDSEVTKVIQEFLKKSGLSEITQEYEGKQIRSRTAMRAYLNDAKNWPEIARAYAEEFSKLMQPGYALPIFNHSGKGTKKEGESPAPFSGEGNPFDKQMHHPEYKKKRVVGAYKAGKGVPALITTFEALDLLYEYLAQRLNLKVEAYTQQTSLPIVYYGKTDFDPDRDKPKHLTFGFDEHGKPTLMRKKYHEDIPLEFKVNPKGFPEARFGLLDTSESMAHSPDCNGGCSNYSCRGNKSIIPWGDNSKYHYALLGWYGLLEYLKQNHLLTQTGISLGNFSSSTYLGKGLLEAKKRALTPQFGSTYLDLDKIKSLLSGERMLVFSISDGEIGNWEDIKDEFIKLAQKHYYFHLQIGGDNKFILDLRANRLSAFNVRGNEDLAKTAIDLTDRLYRGK